MQPSRAGRPSCGNLGVFSSGSIASAFGGKADSDQPLLTNLGVHGLVEPQPSVGDADYLPYG